MVFPAADVRLLNVSDMPVGAEFVELPPWIRREDFSSSPRNRLERQLRWPNLARHRAAWSAASMATGAVLVSHLPRTTAALSIACRAFRRAVPHVAFSFNFTDLPVGFERWRLAQAFRTVDRFFVFSSFEQELYAQYFDIEPHRIEMVSWTQPVPNVSTLPPPLAPRSYVTAVGGEGRNFDTLLKAAALLPDIDFIVIARPKSIRGPVPANVLLMTNAPSDVTWRIALDGTAVLVPLRSDKTCCGHITIVSAQLLGIPVITSHSEATREYTQTSYLFDPSDHFGLASNVRRVHVGWQGARQQAVHALPQLKRRYDRQLWAQALTAFIESAGRANRHPPPSRDH